MDLDFVKLVFETRKAQKLAAKFRTQENVTARDNLEAALDLEIEAKLRPRQVGLSDSDEWNRSHTEDKL